MSRTLALRILKDVGIATISATAAVYIYKKKGQWQKPGTSVQDSASNRPGSTVYFGHEDEWQYFAQHHGPALDALTKAHKTCIDLLKLAHPVGQEQAVIYMLAQCCLKEFEEILLLTGNGYGGGATKLLRSFYERVVTLSYLAKHPNKVQQFVDYTDIHWRKLLTEAEKIHSKVDLTPEQIKTINENFEKSKERFTEVLCKEHNKTRLQMSWTKKPVPDQASEISDPLRWRCFNAYLRPTFYLHSTFVGITWQTQKGEEGKLTCPRR
jgi:hypothetical protein